MATFRKVGSAWRAEVCVNGVRRSATRDTKTQAKDWAVKMEAELKLNKPGSKSVHTLRETLERYKTDESPKKKGARWEELRIDAFIRTLPFIDWPMNDITTPVWAKWRDDRLKQVSPGTVNREMTLLYAVYGVARVEWHWVDHAPLKDVKRPADTPPRDRRISAEEIQVICSALGYADGLAVETLSQQIAVAFLLALETAMRAGEITGLTWGDVNLDGWFVTIPRSKNGDSRQVPLSGRAVELLRMLEGIDPTKCFTVTAASLDALFRKARKRAAVFLPEVATLHFHDTRHEAITQLSKKLTVIQLARMVGHRDLKSLMIYYNETASELAALL